MDPQCSSSGFASEFSDTSAHSFVNFSDDDICGEGASCTVYRMRLGGLRVAVKRLRKEYCSHPAYLASYRKEFSIGQQLKHDGLPVYRELHEGADEVYIVMDFIDGITLSDFLKTEEGKAFFTSTDNARRFFAQLLDVVGYMHRSGVIHCDIKPANILLRHTDRGVMLIDLDKSYSDTLDLTHGGSPDYSTPLPHGEKPTARKDFEAIGRIMDYIAESVTSFPKRKFNEFRSECGNGGATVDSLCKVLHRHSRTPVAGAVIISLCLLGGLAAYSLSYKSSQPDTVAEAVDTARMTDTITAQIAELVTDTPKEVVSVTPAAKSSKKELITPKEIDAALADFIVEVKDALAALSEGTMTEDRYLDMLGPMSISYSSRIYDLTAQYKAAHPDMSPLEVEVEILTVANQSEANKLLNQFMQYGLQPATQPADSTVEITQ